jgi:hypothetical protein
MKLLIGVFATTMMMACAFQPRLTPPYTAARPRSSLLTLTKAVTKAAERGTGGVIDMDRVRECADSFGECSVDELKVLKDRTFLMMMICMTTI